MEDLTVARTFPVGRQATDAMDSWPRMKHGLNKAADVFFRV